MMENQAYEPVFCDETTGSEDAQRAANAVYIDFNKPFNTASHSTLIARWGRYGLNGIQ